MFFGLEYFRFEVKKNLFAVAVNHITPHTAFAVTAKKVRARFSHSSALDASHSICCYGLKDDSLFWGLKAAENTDLIDVAERVSSVTVLKNLEIGIGGCIELCCYWCRLDLIGSQRCLDSEQVSSNHCFSLSLSLSTLSLPFPLSCSCWQWRATFPLLFSRNIISTQLLFQCWIPFLWFCQAEILQGQDLPHGSLALRAAAFRDPVPPGPLQAHGWQGSNTPPYLAVTHVHRTPEWDPPAAPSDYHHRREEGGHAGADRDAQFAQSCSGCSERGPLLWLGESFPEGVALVPQPDALLPSGPADGGKDAGLLHLQQGPETHPSDEPWHQAVAHPQRPHRAGAVGLHPGLLQPPPEAQALPAHRVCSCEGWQDQPGIQGT